MNKIPDDPAPRPENVLEMEIQELENDLNILYH